MSRKEDHRLEEIFSQALEQESLEKRAAFLDGACGRDAELRSRVDALLKAHDEAGGFLTDPVVPRPEGEDPAAEGPGTRIGPYKLLQLIGEGGFGAVYMAEQEEPVRRRVALKIIKLGMDTKQVIARFEAERQALALMEHPNIARVLDAGATDTGRPYFVMELVRGIPINEYCDQNRLSTRARLELFMDVCRAVQHAHLKGVIHRDLKPSNVLVTLHDGTPVPKVIDFGIARATHRRLTEKTLFTEYGQFVGTPEYMSPEQAEMSGLDIDTRTDVYSLGVMLYQLLTGTTPLRRETIQEAGWAHVQEVIRDYEPEIPSTRVGTLGDSLAEVAKSRSAEPTTLSRLIRGDLDWIVMKALEKDRSRRYATAHELASDIERHLGREAVLAGPPSISYKLRKFVARHRVGVTAGAFVAAALLAGLALATFGLVRARQEAARSGAIADFLQDMLTSTDPDRVAGLDFDIEAVVETARKVFGDDHNTVAATLASRAVQLQNTGNLEAAEPLYREALRIWERHEGKDSLNVGITLARLGTLLRLKGDDPGAERALEESLRITGRLTGPSRALRTLPLFELAAVHLNRRQVDQATPLLDECLEIIRETTPEQHLRIAIVLNTKANMLVLANRLDEAEPVVRETLAAFERALPRENQGKVKLQVGFFFLDRGHLDDAEKLFREAIAIYADNPDPPVIDRNLALNGLAGVLSARDDDSVEYAAKRLEYLDLVRRVVAEGDPFRKDMIATQARHLARRGMVVEALELRLEAGSSEGVEDLARAIVGEAGRSAAAYETALRAAAVLPPERGAAAAAISALGTHRLGREDEARTWLGRLRELAATDEGAKDLLEEVTGLLETKDTEDE